MPPNLGKEVLMKKIFVVLSSLVLAISFSFPEQNSITIYHAGSLSYPFKIIAKRFTEKTKIKVLTESGGSRGIIRRVTELGKSADIVASADYRLIKTMMFPKFADFLYEFATNEIVITLSPESKWLNRINSSNWYKIVQNKDFIIGHSDPELDPCGYRSLMVMQLAEKYYEEKGFYNRMRKKIGEKWVRPKSVELLALLETGEMDAAFEYKSVALQHKLPFISLPEKINLSSPKYESFYKTAKVYLTKKDSKKVPIYGKSIVYGITIVKNSQNREGAEKFLKFLLSKEGQELLKKSYQSPLVPPILLKYKGK